MKKIRIFILLFLFGFSVVNANQSITIAVGFESGDLPPDPGDYVIYFGFAPAIFSGISSLSALREREIRVPYLNAKEAINDAKKRRRIRLKSREMLYTYHIENYEHSHFITITSIL